ncbi:MAG: hypothetical protein M5R42_01440 [Rhodocyclaceae bacterium]|nr:hypothetical protein [Rhodocyclaceae bacterium]
MRIIAHASEFDSGTAFRIIRASVVALARTHLPSRPLQGDIIMAGSGPYGMVMDFSDVRRWPSNTWSMPGITLFLIWQATRFC